MKPSIGRIVIFHGHNTNGVNEHPAIITRVWSDVCVNLTVFVDYSSPQLFTSVTLDPEKLNPTGWRWPERV